MQNFWNTILNYFKSNLSNIILFFSVLIIGLLVIKIVMLGLRKAFKGSKLDKTLCGFVLSLAKFVMLLIYIITLCAIIGIPITSLVAIVTALSLAVGLAVQSAVSNVANGIVLLAAKPFKEGDYVEIGSVAGCVVALKMLNTTLRTVTNELVIIPNSQMSTVVITNYSAEAKRRVDILVSVDYNADIDFVKELLTNIAREHEMVLADEPIVVRLHSCSASALDFTMRSWVETPNYWTAKFDMQETVIHKLRENNINIPYQTIDVNICNNNSDTSDKA